jgi:hypothetical protein
VSAPAIQVIERLFAVARDYYFISKVVLGQAGEGKLHILGIVFD